MVILTQLGNGSEGANSRSLWRALAGRRLATQACVCRPTSRQSEQKTI